MLYIKCLNRFFMARFHYNGYSYLFNGILCFFRHMSIILFENDICRYPRLLPGCLYAIRNDPVVTHVSACCQRVFPYELPVRCFRQYMIQFAASSLSLMKLLYLALVFSNSSCVPLLMAPPSSTTILSAFLIVLSL